MKSVSLTSNECINRLSSSKKPTTVSMINEKKIKIEAKSSTQMTTNLNTAIATTEVEAAGLAQEGGIRTNTENLSKPSKNMEKIGEKYNNMLAPEVQHRPGPMRRSFSRDSRKNI